ncbi:MAG: phage/plasmid primase, P4 family, partial [Methanoregula sp.]|nr:phage/plasmid primase, P4 family [Methanoregula sp.]
EPAGEQKRPGGAGPMDTTQRLNLYESRRKLTEIGNSEEFVEIYGDEVKYCYEMRKWLYWDTRRWRVDNPGNVEKKAKNIVIGIYQDAAREDDTGLRQEIIKHAERSNNAAGVANLLRCARVDIVISENDLDIDGYLLNLRNGTLDLRTLELKPHNKDDLLSKITNTEYLPDAPCPQWIEHIKTVFDGDRDLITTFQEIAGYTLAGIGNPEAGFFVLHGKGRNGKSVTLKVLEHLFGDYAVNIAPQSLAWMKWDRVRTDLLHMRGARLITATEPKKSIKLDDGLIKSLTGGDRITARHLYGEEIDFNISGTLFLASNYKPRIDDQSVAMWHRVWLLPFNHYFSPDDADTGIYEKLIGEAPGILNWLIEGWRRYQVDGKLKKCDTIAKETKEYQYSEDIYHEFLKNFEINPARSDYQIKASEFYKKYSIWCIDEGVPKISQTVFGREMGSRFRKVRLNDGYYFGGICEKEQAKISGTDAGQGARS